MQILADQMLRLSKDLRELKINYDEKDRENERLRQELNEIKQINDGLGRKTWECERLEKDCAEKEHLIKEQERLIQILEDEKEEISKDLEKIKRNYKEKDDEHSEGKNKIINDGIFAYMNNKISDAVNIFDEALSTGTSSKMEAPLLYVFRAMAKSAAQSPDNMAIIMDCCMAIEKGLKGWKVYQVRGKHLMNEGLFSVAVQDFETVNRIVPSDETMRNLKRAKEGQEKWEDQSHYEALGVKQTATKADILRAFKDLSMKYHPDRHREKPEIIQEAFQEKFKRITNAKTVLTDAEKRKLYDRELHQHNVMHGKSDPRPKPHQQRAQPHHFYQRQPRPEYTDDFWFADGDADDIQRMFDRIFRFW
ncbi:dnaJ homolog subfamily C member 7-like [Macrobrachium rosenbergii]|uniref:dnaJ homolog subfamily C member 7-like n=1 Tax=Macrobrachium rosenbergii TaxID=79674 RepID=UPI0034D6E9E1